MSAYARAGAAGAGVDVDAGVVGAYGWADASGRVRVRDHGGDVDSLPNFEGAVEAARASPEEGESDDGCVIVGAGVSANGNGSGGTDCHVYAHTAAVDAGDMDRDQDEMALVPM